MLPRKEIKRQIFHLLVGIIFITLIYLDIIDFIVAGIMVVAAFIISFFGLKRYRMPIFYRLMRQLDRPKDIKRFPGKGSVFFILGMFFVLLLFEKDIAMASIVILAVGDSIGPLVGQYGRIKHLNNNKKHIEGTIAGGVLAFAAATLFINPIEAGLGAVIGMAAECIDFKLGREKIDDNFVMPLAAGAAIWLLRYLT